ETEFRNVAVAPTDILRGKFKRYAHDKVFIVSKAGAALKVLTGSTNFAVTGVYVNSNHVLVFDEPTVATLYQQAFQQAWTTQVQQVPFQNSAFSQNDHGFTPPGLPQMTITLAPHLNPRSQSLMDALATRILKEGKKPAAKGSVLFAVMDINSGKSPV